MIHSFMFCVFQTFIDVTYTTSILKDIVYFLIIDHKELYHKLSTSLYCSFCMFGVILILVKGQILHFVSQ